ncbi:BAH_G0015620.mRNA.1.CDS.1 [Saccharomyces cerevisiae]|nr:SX2_G0002210.mRNA.1.CDS.1 [Saccharomyces cerevisiae]CAI4443393.1 BAG_1a_G0015740.mRNA.1.CDS.1 [Saccharomyces cerevisiae]CAI4446876.1 BAH_G0015620.mRNA.1.CDS.1 [Saccharomyces cerevisiae]CAI7109079.1 BAH_G0015620.mRNA.1.CDS.1 [Saccharomyces cerevisiae]CAI7109135.1 BAG_1a_G0015740.mRNA.1.CDS.1 [Saccharomyces cerevisiae]
MLFRNIEVGRQAAKLLTRTSSRLAWQSIGASRNISTVRQQIRKTQLYNFKKTMSIRPFSLSSPVFKPHVASESNPIESRLKTSKNVAYWLIGTSGLVFGIVVLGGLTRLTESGLSITEWKPVTGTLPPMNQKEWEEEFIKYKESPEFKLLNSHIDLDEFKFIFFMEWIHRLWGRAIGAVFILPAVYFAVSKKTSGHVNKRLFGLAGLLGLQGFVGWWMVKSGLDQEQLDARKSKPTVSQYRLTTHLGTAFFLYMGMLWTGLEILRECKWIKNPVQAISLFKKLDNPAIGPMRKISLALLAVSFLTAMSGGMVAGLDAGWVYNTWPKMGERWFPSSRELMDENFCRREDKKDLWWRNLLENPVTVQLVHRTCAYVAFTSVLAAHMYAIKKKAVIPRNAMTSLHVMMGVVTLQATLGILTILYLVPISLASIHQAGALALLTSSLVFASQLRKPRAPMRNVIITLPHSSKVTSGKILSEASKLASKPL